MNIFYVLSVLLPICSASLNTTTFEGKVYFKSVQMLTYESAVEYCIANGGKLVQINSLAEQNWIVETYIPRWDSSWIGLFSTSGIEGLEWFDGTNLTYSNLSPDQSCTRICCEGKILFGYWLAQICSGSRNTYALCEKAQFDQPQVSCRLSTYQAVYKLSYLEIKLKFRSSLNNTILESKNDAHHLNVSFLKDATGSSSSYQALSSVLNNEMTAIDMAFESYMQKEYEMINTNLNQLLIWKDANCSQDDLRAVSDVIDHSISEFDARYDTISNDLQRWEFRAQGRIAAILFRLVEENNARFDTLDGGLHVKSITVLCVVALLLVSAVLTGILVHQKWSKLAVNSDSDTRRPNSARIVVYSNTADDDNKLLEHATQD